MADYYKLKVEPMTGETFGPYGTLLDAKDQPKITAHSSPSIFRRTAEQRSTSSGNLDKAFDLPSWNAILG